MERSSLVEGDELFDAMLRDMRRAAESVRLESYILAADAVRRAFLDEAGRCASRGIQTRVRADQAGSWLDLSRADIVSMRRAGVHFEWSRPWSRRRPFSVNRRNHRKLIVVDKSIAYVGGYNIHAQGSGRVIGDGRWRDTHVRFVGDPAAAAAGCPISSPTSASHSRDRSSDHLTMAIWCPSPAGKSILLETVSVLWSTTQRSGALALDT